jgi:hypothetical protein
MLAIGAVAVASGCAKPCDGYLSCTDYGPAFFADGYDDATAACRRMKGSETNPDGGSEWCSCYCEN